MPAPSTGSTSPPRTPSPWPRPPPASCSCSEATVHSDPLLRCRDLRYAYLDRFSALDGVSFDVAAGETLALLGANGCGKSTLLKVLDGLIFPTAGSYEAFGHAVTEDHLEDEQFSAAFRSRVGFIFQNTDAQVFSPS